MSLISKIGDKFGEKLLGVIIADYGTLPANQQGWTVAITLRRQKAGYPNLVFKWQCGGDTTWQKLEASPDVIARLETILQETRQQLK